MDRTQAVVVLKDIVDNCTGLDDNTITLMPSKARGIMAKGFQIHITAEMSQEARDCIKRTTEKYGLKFHEGEGRLMIYTPASGML